MSIYITDRGERFSAKNEAELVRKLRRASFVPCKNEREYMHDVAERAKLRNRRTKISTADYESFISDLISCGLLTEETTHDDD